ncbi:10667_t:CDS:1, partial [Racocetra fulgida]
MSAQEMHNALQEFVDNGELNSNDLPKESTIKNWISNFASIWKK